MSYAGGVHMNLGVLRRERQMLLGGFSYRDIAHHLGEKVGTIRERNRCIHKVDIWRAFRARIRREGIPSRLAVTDAFGHWFSGLFDGEGCLFVMFRHRPDRYREFRHSVRISLRDDDAHVLRRIHDQLKVGRVGTTIRRDKSLNPAAFWVCEKVQDLAEVMVPLFDKYPLYTKKAREYRLWRRLVLTRYAATMGGYSNRKRTPERECMAFHAALKAIKEIRAYRK